MAERTPETEYNKRLGRLHINLVACISDPLRLATTEYMLKATEGATLKEIAESIQSDENVRLMSGDRSGEDPIIFVIHRLGFLSNLDQDTTQDKLVSEGYLKEGSIRYARRVRMYQLTDLGKILVPEALQIFQKWKAESGETTFPLPLGSRNSAASLSLAYTVLGNLYLGNFIEPAFVREGAKLRLIEHGLINPNFEITERGKLFTKHFIIPLTQRIAKQIGTTS